ncbi:MAG: 2-oxoglutarate dehydrogenase complex dihydrolipoyllysine-residue succinyltransferase [Pseudomonadota bacterium]
MGVEIRVPALGESISEATIGKWFKKEGEAVNQDEPLVELETEKVTVEVPAPAGGVLTKITVKEGDTIAVGGLLGSIMEGAAKAAAAPAVKKAEPTKTEAAPAKKESLQPAKPANTNVDTDRNGPAVARLATESGKAVPAAGSGKDGRVTKGDMMAAVEAGASLAATTEPAKSVRAPSPQNDSAREERVKMTKLRQTIARRLKEAQNTAAMLTTFNEVDMSAVMDLRKEYKDMFEKKHGVKLGFMSFFVKAVVQALKEIPAVNAEIDGTDLIYKNYYHIGIAVGTEKGLVVPVLRDADQLSFAEVEKNIGVFGQRARDGQLTIEDFQGGTFTISNGGVYGSLMSTPILNAPQSGILGMHKIQERPMVVDGKVVVRPMMYLALSYDHRVIDGKEAVTFLVRVKEDLEDPARLIMDL